jgi:anti-anti-sigma factor
MSTTLSPVPLLTPLRIDTSYPSSATVRVTVVGEIDLATASELHAGLRCALSRQAPDLLDVDLGGVTFMDCTGLGVLVAVRNAAIRSGCQLRVTNPQPIVRRILELTGLLGVFTPQVDQPVPAPIHSVPAARNGSAPTALTQPLDLLVAA